MSDIFLSYNEKDRDAVRRLAETFRSVGWSVWWDRRIPAGGTWRSLLERELQSMRCMVVVWSSHSIASDWVHEEATEGRLAGRLVPVSIEAVRPPPGFREIQCADLVGWDGTMAWPGMRTLIEDLEAMIGRPSNEPPRIVVPPTMPTPPAPVPPRPTFEVSISSSPPLPSGRQVTVFGLVLLALVVALYFGLHRATGSSSDATRADTLAKEESTKHATVDDGTTANGDRSLRDASSGKPEIGTPTKGSRCADLLQRASLGETLAAADRNYITRECHS